MSIKKGDKVSVVDGGYDMGPQTGTVVEVGTHGGYMVVIDNAPMGLRDPLGYYYFNSEVTLIEEEPTMNTRQTEIILDMGDYYTDVDDIFNQMGEGARCHMMNKLFKAGYRSPKMYVGRVVNIDGVDYRLVRDGE